MIAICAAMDRELVGLERRLSGLRSVDGHGFPVRRGHLGGAVLTCRTGVGRRSENAARALLTLHRPEALLSVGLCGALDRDLRVGDVVVCESVVGSGDASGEVSCDDRLLQRAVVAAEASGSGVRRGTAVTVDRVVGPSEKENLRLSTGCDVADMESFWLANVAADADVPFLAVRAVLDSADQSVPLPQGVAVRADGSTRLMAVLAYAFSHPGSLVPLLSTARAQSRAIDSLTRFLEVYIGTLHAAPAAGVGTAV